MNKRVIIEILTKRKEIDEDTVDILDECFGGIGDDRDIRIPDTDISELEYNTAVKRLLEYIFSDDGDDMDSLYGDIEEDDTVLISEGELSDDGENVVISYEEGDENGLSGTSVKIFFPQNDPTLVSMLREGDMNTMLSFETGKRHKSVYNTPYMPFDLTVNTLEVDNTVLYDGRLYLNYVMEVHGLCHDRISLNLRIRNADVI